MRLVRSAVLSSLSGCASVVTLGVGIALAGVNTPPQNVWAKAERLAVRLDWTSGTGDPIISYEISRSRDLTPGVGYFETAGPDTFATLAMLPLFQRNEVLCKGPWYFWVRSQHVTGWTDWSPVYAAVDFTGFCLDVGTESESFAFAAEPSAKGVVVTWPKFANTTPTVGYHVFRASRPGGARTRLNASLLPSTARGFEDVTAGGSASAVYQVAAVDGRGAMLYSPPIVSAAATPVPEAEPISWGELKGQFEE